MRKSLDLRAPYFRINPSVQLKVCVAVFSSSISTIFYACSRQAGFLFMCFHLGVDRRSLHQEGASAWGNLGDLGCDTWLRSLRFEVKSL
jgi:hypothetical protein